MSLHVPAGIPGIRHSALRHSAGDAELVLVSVDSESETAKGDGTMRFLLRGETMGSITMMVLVVVILAVAVVVAAIFKKAGTRAPKPDRPLRRQLLTSREREMFNALRTAAPETILLAQVSFSALIDAKQRAIRNTFDRKTTDFVLCDSTFEEVVVIELDDSSHRGREKEDAEREKLLTDAGYKVIRFRSIPTAEEARRRLTDALTP